MLNDFILVYLSLVVVACGQQVGNFTAENHPALSWQKCTITGGCAIQSSGQVVLDSNWRWIHSIASATNCFTGNTWDSTLCPDPVTCAQNCALDGAEYTTSTYGITTSGNALSLKFGSTATQGETGSRVYLMANETEYQIFKPLNQEFSFDVDVSNLPCGFNGALYFTQMDADGGMARFPTNKAGAKYGTGYCDSQCPQDVLFIDGQANNLGFEPSTKTGQYGSCCNELDIWEANSDASVFIAHSCTVQGQTRCTSAACGNAGNPSASVCDADGCDFNSYRDGDKTFYGGGLTVDTTKPFTVVTQFITSNGTASGTLSEIRRLYVQNGKVIQNSNVNVPGIPTSYNSITTQYCTDQKEAFGDVNYFQTKGGLATLSNALASGMVLVFSLRNDPTTNMNWLDSIYPPSGSPTTPGVARGTCPPTAIATLPITSNTQPFVTFSNIKFGDIGLTNSTGTTITTTTTTSKPPGSTTTPAPEPTQTKYGECGGIGYTGPTVCAAGSTCTYSNPYYSQCL